MSDVKTNSPLVPTARKEGDALVASVAGDIDLNNSPVLRATLFELLRNHSPKKLILNLAAVPYMDSSAIAVLVELMRKMKGGKIVLASLQPRVKGLLEIARLDSIFAVTGTEQEALAR